MQARQVYAIETEEVVNLAKTICAENGLSDRVQFIQRDSRKTVLPEQVKVIISDIRGTLPLFDHAIPSINDARERFLLPDGIMIPQRDTLQAVVVEAKESYDSITSPWLASEPRARVEFELKCFSPTSLLSDILDWQHSSLLGCINCATCNFTCNRSGERDTFAPRH